MLIANTKRNIKTLLVLFSLILLVCITGSSFADESREEYYDELTSEPSYEVLKADVLEITFDDLNIDKPDTPKYLDVRYQQLKVRIKSGPHKGEVFHVRNTVEMVNPYKLIFEKGDVALLRVTEDDSDKIINIQVYEKGRDGPIFVMITVFLLMLIAIGGRKGLNSVVSLIVTGLLIYYILLPLILDGYSPIWVSLLVSVLSTVITFLLISGNNRKTYSALIGTVGGLLIGGIFAYIIGSMSSLTGLSSEDAQLLAYLPQSITLDFKGILFAGILIGALGAIMDVTLSVASAMFEVESVHPEIKTPDLIKSGMNVGRDVMGSMSNTLILAYTGGALQMMLLFIAFKLTMVEIMNMDIIATELVRAFAGSIGIVSAIPLTALSCGMLRHRENSTK